MDQYSIDFKWLSIAWSTAIMSKDPNTKVGAVIVSKDNRQCSTGYNGFPVGIEETDKKWERPIKYEYVIHAEQNAICNCPFDTMGCRIYITHEPCHRCFGLLVNAGIKEVVYDIPYQNQKHLDVWSDINNTCDITVRRIEQQIRQKLINKIQNTYDK